jgi:hypothetical protein
MTVPHGRHCQHHAECNPRHRCAGLAALSLAAAAMAVHGSTCAVALKLDRWGAARCALGRLSELSSIRIED